MSKAGKEEIKKKFSYNIFMIIDLEIIGIKNKDDGFLIRDTIEQALLTLLPRCKKLITINVEIALDKDMKDTKALVHLEDDNEFVIALNENVLKTKKDVILTLCHECVHIKQHISKDYLQIDGNFIKFKNEIVDLNLTKYTELPWEKEAYKLEEELANAQINYAI
tara:strand:+ start:8884 stop:9378 length:495 start_codon:yes stop_codon:yes gene_type:complete